LLTNSHRANGVSFGTGWILRWDSLVDRVEERNKGLPQLTEEEIYAEFAEHRFPACFFGTADLLLY
jgi:hypothetical protein